MRSWRGQIAPGAEAGHGQIVNSFITEQNERFAMAEISTKAKSPSPVEREQMHALYRQGGQERQMAPYIVYQEADCPYAGCSQQMQAIDFRLEDHGRAVHDPLVHAWWNDTGFAGRCPHCGGWIHFTIRAKRAINEEEAAGYPQLPENWHSVATIL